MLSNTVTERTVAIYNNGGTTLQNINLYGNGLLCYVQQPGNNRYYYMLVSAECFYEDGKDHLGSIRQVIHKTADYENDNVVASKNYQPYGGIIAAYNSATDDRYNFTEKERDKETGFDYFGARYYDSEIGRWTTVDPLADLFPGKSPYSYANNNPLRYFDILGLSAKDTVDSDEANTFVYELPLITVMGRTAINVLSRFAGIASLVFLSGDTDPQKIELYNETLTNKKAVEGLVKGPVIEHLNKLSGNFPGKDPNDPYGKKTWKKHLQKALNEISKKLKKLNKPLEQVLRERGWDEESIGNLFNRLNDAGFKVPKGK
ncbi:hypothetical protein BMS3Abin04_01595 [bacterium BMS3Abin04]|nr:hypothetical protein BMS3Abin04_01595 [bacterium BMS3Abin04]